MSINSTLIGQAITFLIFVWFTMKYVWPVIMNAMLEREQKIADGLAAGERGHHELERATQQANEILAKARDQAAELLDKAAYRADVVIGDAEVAAKEKYNQIVASAQGALEQQEIKLREELRKQVVDIAMLGAAKIIKTNIDSKAQNDLINDLVGRL